MAKPLYLLIGRSASGKTTIANRLTEKYGYKSISSYTTRPPRYDGEEGHIFINDATFDQLGELAGFVEYNGYRYGTTMQQVDEADIYVIDPIGAEYLLDKYVGRPICIIYFDASIPTRIHRMLDRGDSDNAIIRRLLQDEEYDWQSKLESTVWKQVYLENKHVAVFRVDANKQQSDVLEQVLYYIRKFNGDDYA
jgi:guanylate kinase